MIKLSDYVFKFIAALGVKNVFVLPGGGCMHLVDSLGKNKKLKFTCCLHEQAAAIAAEAYSQYTGNLGVALVTTGPGGTNAITGVAGAWMDSTPLLVISGQVKRQDMIGKSGLRQKGNQEIDIVSIVKPITKYAVSVLDPMDIRYHLQKAIYLARSGRSGPVWLDIPLDVQGSMVDENKLREFVPNLRHADKKQVGSYVQKTIKLLNSSKRPVILAGNGIRLSGALGDFIRLTRILNVPVLTTWKAVDFLPENDRLFFGRPGSVGQRAANFIQQTSDFILILGSRLDLPQTAYNHKNFAPSAKKVIVDIDRAEIKKLRTVIDVAACVDVKSFIGELIENKNKIKHVDRLLWVSQCLKWKNSYKVVLPEYYKTRKFVNTYVLIDILSELMSPKDILVPGSSGACSEITMQAFRVKKGQRIFNDPGFGSMGFGLPASIGACIASEGKRTVSIIGDGGLQHNIQELETVSRLGIPLKLFILNNNGYGSIRNTQRTHFKSNYVCCDPESGMTIPETLRIARAYKIKAFRLSDQGDLKTKLKKILATKGPVVCEVMTDPDLQTAPRVSSRVLPDGSIVSRPMEDLWPFLDRGEFEANMSVKDKE